MRKLLCATALLALAGCVETLPTPEKPVDFVSTRNARAYKVVATDKVAFRSYVKSAENKQTEVAGAKCTLTTDGLKTSFVTPAHVNLPRTQPKAGDIAVSCSMGDLRHANTLKAVLPTGGASVNTGGVGSSIVATILVSAVAHGVASARDIWAYMPAGSTYSAVMAK